MKTSLIILVCVVLLNLALALVKLYVGLSSNSICILLDATNSFFDILTGLVAVIAFALLLLPKKGFGYGRGEYVAGFIVAVVSVVFGGVFLLRSVNRIAMPEPVWFTPLYCALVAAAVPVKLGIGLFVFHKNKKIKSKTLSAVALDSFLDAGVTTATLISFVVSSNVNYAVDAVFGIVISIVVIIFAVKLVADNVKVLLTGDSSEEERACVARVCEKDERISRVENVVLHDYGYGCKTGNAEVEYAYGISLEDAELCAEELRKKIAEECGAEVSFVPVRRK